MQRRSFVQAGLAAVSAAGDMPVIDYARSFLQGKWAENRVRFWVESRTRIIDDKSGRREDFYQCASCKSEDTFAKRNLFYKNNYDFLPVFGPTDGVIFRRTTHLNPRYRELKKSGEMWEGQDYRIRQPRSCRLLNSNAAVRKATDDGFIIVAQTEISESRTGLRAILEYPVKTINIHDAKDLYQVDTGPIAFPDLATRHERWAASLSLAFVAFNSPGFADFVIEDATPLVENGREVSKVHHYSKIVSLPGANRLFACEL